MLIQSLFSTRIVDLNAIERSKERVLEEINKSLPYHNISFRDKINNYSIDTIGEGGHFKVFSIDPERDWVFTSKCKALKIKNKNDLAELIVNYSDEKLKEYDEDKIFQLKDMIDNLSPDEKDEILLGLLSKEIK
ncbi:hypothetical protein [Lysinibacillus sp. FSL K6-0102]|uniref:hypothetical protein n=1 Tax=Lysinibacillus sp. FSL K6-0102 TaxID=2975290 RepID=UPI0030F780D4